MNVHELERLCDEGRAALRKAEKRRDALRRELTRSEAGCESLRAALAEAEQRLSR